MSACKKCGRDTSSYSVKEECANCWEVERRLWDYLQSAHGREFVRRELRRADRRDRLRAAGFIVTDSVDEFSDDIEEDKNGG